MDFGINWLAVIAGTVAHQALGALWYAVVFRDTWLRAMGMRAEDIERQSPGGGLAIGAIASLLSVIALALILNSFEDPTLAGGITVGAVTGIGFVAASTFMNAAYEQKKPILSVLFGAYYTLGLMIVGAIVGAWR